MGGSRQDGLPPSHRPAPWRPRLLHSPWCLYRVVEPGDRTALARPPGPLSAWSLKNDPVLPSECSAFVCSLHSGHTAFTTPTASPRRPSPRLCASVSCCADPSGSQAKSPLCHWTGRLRGRGASVWHFLVSQDKQEGTGSGLACLPLSPCPVPVSLGPADPSPPLPRGPSSGPPHWRLTHQHQLSPPVTQMPARSRPSDTPHCLHLWASCRLCPWGWSWPLQEPLATHTLGIPTQQNRSLPASLCKQQSCPGTRGVWVNQGAPEALPAIPTYPPLAEPASHLRSSGPQWPEPSSAQDSLADPAQGCMALLCSCSLCCVGGPHSLPDTSEHLRTLHSPQKLGPWRAAASAGTPTPHPPLPLSRLALSPSRPTPVLPLGRGLPRGGMPLPPPLGWPPQQAQAQSGPLPQDPTAPGLL